MIEELLVPLNVNDYLKYMSTSVGINDDEVVRRYCRKRDLARLKAVRLEGGNGRPWVITVKMVDIGYPERMALINDRSIPDCSRRGFFEAVNTMLRKKNLHVNKAGSIEPRHWPEKLAYYAGFRRSGVLNDTTATGTTYRAGSLSGASYAHRHPRARCTAGSLSG
jgi:hypothetical protein